MSAPQRHRVTHAGRPDVDLVVAQKRSYFVFMLRELSSVFVAWFVVYLLLLVARGRPRGERRTTTSSTGPARPGCVVLNVVAFAFVVLHAVTWFNLTPQAMDVRLRGRPVPGGRDHRRRSTPAWLVVSAFV